MQDRHYASEGARRAALRGRKKKNKGKSLKRRAFEELWDVIEDIFD